MLDQLVPNLGNDGVQGAHEASVVRQQIKAVPRHLEQGCNDRAPVGLVVLGIG